MNKKTKRFLFWSTIVLFIIVAPLIIIYAQGYKYSFFDRKFYLTGALTLRANTEAQVFLDGNLEGETSFFGNSFGIDGLLPGTYNVALQKENYATWRKDFSIAEGFITDFSNIILIPIAGEPYKNLLVEVVEIFEEEPEPKASLTPTPKTTPRTTPTPTPYPEPFFIEKGKLFQSEGQILKEIDSNIISFEISPDKNKLSYWTPNEVWVIWLNDQNYQPFHKKYDKELIARFSNPLSGLAWFRGSTNLVARFGRDESAEYKIMEIDTRGGVNMVAL